jgi:hypothetical protein
VKENILTKNVFICGASRGWALFLADSFDKKFNVTLNIRKKKKFEKKFKFMVADMSNLSEKIFEKYNPHIIINNGFSKKEYIHSFKSQIRVLKEAFNFFKKKGSGKIININSYYGLFPDNKDPDYAAVKYGLRGYAESIASESFKNNVQIINIYPRAINAGINKKRDKSDQFICPKELADFIVMLCETKTFYCSSIVIERLFNK